MLLAGVAALAVACVTSFLLSPASWALYVESLGWQAGSPLVGGGMISTLPTAAADFALRLGIAAAFVGLAIRFGSDRIAYAASVITVPTLWIARVVPMLAVLQLPGARRRLRG